MRASSLAAPLAALLLLAMPANAAVFGNNVAGTWTWRTGDAAAPAVPATATIFLGDDGEFFFRVNFDPAKGVHAQCLNGVGFFRGVVGPSVPLDSCALGFTDGEAVPSLSWSAPGLGAPAQVRGSGSFLLA